jgi:hypothetical protein
VGGYPGGAPDRVRGSRRSSPRTRSSDDERHELAFNVRNAIVHPPKKFTAIGRPKDGELVEAWQLATWYLELGILRLLDFNGSFRSRLNLSKWAAAEEPVPWV